MSTTLVREKKVNCLQEKLTELELQIAKGQKAFYQIGSALKIIRDEGLYSSSHSSLGNYCQQVWEMSKRKANYLISAAGVIDNLKNYFGCDENNCSQIPLPTNESQVRELAKLSSEKQIKIWEEIVGKVGNGEVLTAKLVKKTISEHCFGSGNDLLSDLPGLGNCKSIRGWDHNKTFNEDENIFSQHTIMNPPTYIEDKNIFSQNIMMNAPTYIFDFVGMELCDHATIFDFHTEENFFSEPSSPSLLTDCLKIFDSVFGSLVQQSQVYELAKFSTKKQIKILKRIARKVRNGEVLTEKLVGQTISDNLYFFDWYILPYSYYKNKYSQIPLLTNEFRVRQSESVNWLNFPQKNR